MKRPIPEGVNLVCKCGWRGLFDQSAEFGGAKGWCPRCSENGYILPLKEADAGSEVARLNQEDPLMNAVFGVGNCRGDIAFGNHCGDCERCKSYGWTKEDPLDGAIRVLRDALYDMVAVAKADGWREATTGRQIILKAAESALANGCSENSSS